MNERPCARNFLSNLPLLWEISVKGSYKLKREIYFLLWRYLFSTSSFPLNLMCKRKKCTDLEIASVLWQSLQFTANRGWVFSARKGMGKSNAHTKPKGTSSRAWLIVKAHSALPLNFKTPPPRKKSKCSVRKLMNWQMPNMIFWIMFNVIWFREFCGWLSYLEYEQ